jgi:hypothetical protein
MKEPCHPRPTGCDKGDGRDDGLLRPGRRGCAGERAPWRRARSRAAWTSPAPTTAAPRQGVIRDSGSRSAPLQPGQAQRAPGWERLPQEQPEPTDAVPLQVEERRLPVQQEPQTHLVVGIDGAFHGRPRYNSCVVTARFLVARSRPLSRPHPGCTRRRVGDFIHPDQLRQRASPWRWSSFRASGQHVEALWSRRCRTRTLSAPPSPCGLPINVMHSEEVDVIGAALQRSVAGAANVEDKGARRSANRSSVRTAWSPRPSALHSYSPCQLSHVGRLAS